MLHLPSIALLASLALVACSKKDKAGDSEPAPEPAGKITAGESEPPTAADEPAATAPGPGSGPLDPISGKLARAVPSDVPSEGVPPLSLDPVDPKRIEAAAALNKKGLASQRADELDEAIESYEAALRQDPGYLLARYNLATAHSRAGNTAPAIATLKQFHDAAASHASVRGRLARAKEDKDFEPLRSDPTFVELTQDVGVETVPLKEAAESMAQAFAGELATAADLLHPRATIVVTDTNEGGCDEDCTTTARYHGSAHLVQGAMEFGLSVFRQIDACKDDCCSFRGDIRGDEEQYDGVLGGATVRLDKVCFKVDSGGFRYLTRVEATSDPNDL